MTLYAIVVQSHIVSWMYRAINDQLVDTYQLKSLDGQFGKCTSAQLFVIPPQSMSLQPGSQPQHCLKTLSQCMPLSS